MATTALTCIGAVGRAITGRTGPTNGGASAGLSGPLTKELRVRVVVSQGYHHLVGVLESDGRR